MKILLSLLLLCAPLTAQWNPNPNTVPFYNFKLHYAVASVYWSGNQPLIVAVMIRPDAVSGHRSVWAEFQNVSPAPTLARLHLEAIYTYESRPCNWGRTVWHNYLDIGGQAIGQQTSEWNAHAFVRTIDETPYPVGNASSDYWLSYCNAAGEYECGSPCPIVERLHFWDAPQMYAVVFGVSTYPNPVPFP